MLINLNVLVDAILNKDLSASLADATLFENKANNPTIFRAKSYWGIYVTPLTKNTEKKLVNRK